MDRNSCGGAFARPLAASLSARRAWIEISRGDALCLTLPVALRKESVDRNFTFPRSALLLFRRSPQGERG